MSNRSEKQTLVENKFRTVQIMGSAEMITQKIVETIRSEKDLMDMAVEVKTEIEGRTASYPVDLYMEFGAEDGINYKIIVQTATVDQELNKNELFHFANVLQDISGQVLGVVFTQPVYDKLVQDVAKDVGVMLYEMRNLEDQPVWEPNVSNVKVEVDKEWVKAEREKYGIDDTPIQAGGHPKYMYLYDEEDLCIDSVEGIFNGHIKERQETKEFEPISIRHAFDKHAAYLKTEHALIPKVKLKEISFDISFRNVTALDGKEIVRNILRTALAAKLN